MNLDDTHGKDHLEIVPGYFLVGGGDGRLDFMQGLYQDSMYADSSCMNQMHSTKRKRVYSLIRMMDIMLRNDQCWRELKEEHLP